MPLLLSNRPRHRFVSTGPPRDRGPCYDRIPMEVEEDRHWHDGESDLGAPVDWGEATQFSRGKWQRSPWALALGCPVLAFMTIASCVAFKVVFVAAEMHLYATAEKKEIDRLMLLSEELLPDLEEFYARRSIYPKTLATIGIDERARFASEYVSFEYHTIHGKQFVINLYGDDIIGGWNRYSSKTGSWQY